MKPPRITKRGFPPPGRPSRQSPDACAGESSVCPTGAGLLCSFELDPGLRFLHVCPCCAELPDALREQRLTGTLFTDLVREADRAKVRGHLDLALQGQCASFAFQPRGDDSVPTLSVWLGPRMDGDPGSGSAIHGILLDITEPLRGQDFQEGQFEILARLATGASLESILDALVLLIEGQSPGMVGSVLILDRDAEVLRYGAGPSLDPDYVSATDGLPIGPAIGSCGTAASTGRRVVVEDVLSDPLWRDFRGLATTFGLAACWSEPIRSSTQEILGTFAMYYRRPRGPRPEELRLIERAAHLAGLAIEHRRNETALREARDDLEVRVRERTAELIQANAELEKEIHRRERLEQLARQRQEELAHVLRVSTMGEFVAELAHELNQPLEAIVNYADVCIRSLQSDPAPPRLGDDLDQIAAEAQRADRIIRRLRSFVRRGEPEREPGDVHEIIQDIAPLLDTVAARHDIPVRYELDSEAHQVLADPVRIQQVLLNLARNGIEAMAEARTEDPRLTITTRCCDDLVEVAVSDRGPGIPGDIAAKVFHSFVTTRPDGMGLGLSITRTIVESHGGRVWYQPDPDGGASFRFTLPLANGEARG